MAAWRPCRRGRKHRCREFDHRQIGASLCPRDSAVRLPLCPMEHARLARPDACGNERGIGVAPAARRWRAGDFESGVFGDAPGDRIERRDFRYAALRRRILSHPHSRPCDRMDCGLYETGRTGRPGVERADSRAGARNRRDARRDTGHYRCCPDWRPWP